MRGVSAVTFVYGRKASGLVGSALIVATLLLSATSVQAMGLGGKAAEPGAPPADMQGAPAGSGEAAMPDKPATPPAMSAPAAGGVPKTMMAPSALDKAATMGDRAPVVPPAVMAAPPAQSVTPPALTPPAVVAAPAAKPAAPTMAVESAPKAATPAMTATQVPLAAGQKPSVASPVALEKPTEQPSDFSGRKADYYDNRAKEKLAAESKEDGPGRQHPLQLALPSHNVIVCEAGCLKEGVYVVSKTLKATVRPAVAPLSPNMPTAGVVGRDRALDCRGGCDRPEIRMGVGAPRPAVAPLALNESAGRWLTSVTPEAADVQAPAPAPKMGKPEAPAAKIPMSAAPEAAAPAAQPSKAAKVSREDWLARINRERAAEKSADRAADMLAPAKPE